jgi:uncharacterized protein YlxW (UPF0749 family)
MNEYMFRAFRFCIVLLCFNIMSCATPEPDDCDPAKTSISMSLLCSSSGNFMRRENKLRSEIINIQNRSDRLFSLLQEYKSRLEIIQIEIQQQPPRIAGRAGGCPEGSPCPKHGDCIDVAPVGDGIGWDGDRECKINNDEDPGTEVVLRRRLQMHEENLRRLISELEAQLDSES